MGGFDFDDLARSLARSRRVFLGGALAITLGRLEAQGVDAKRKRKRKRRPKNRTCGGGPACVGNTVCQSGVCFPTGTCQPGTQACIPASGTKCGDDCFCVTSVERNTVCVESAGFCANFPGTCSNTSSKEACSNCTTSNDCGPRQACVDVTACCEGPILPGPLPAGTTICVDACVEPDV
jgi:hypothetical protein